MTRGEKINFLISQGWSEVYNDDNWTFDEFKMINYNGFTLEDAFLYASNPLKYRTKLLRCIKNWNDNEEFMSKTQTFKEFISSMFDYQELLDEIDIINKFRNQILKNINEL